MRLGDIIEYVETHYNDFPNFTGRTIDEIVRELPDQDSRYETIDGLADMLNEIDYRSNH
ncbi:MAG: hypothetical protein ACYTEQ_28600 [Planctomycetota bacterium]|jgi:hypothetical protein